MDCIKNIDDVKRFFRYLYEERKVAFHPDETFDGYVSWGEDIPAFTPSECKIFDSMMDECFKVCEAADIDIYETASTIRDNVIYNN